MGNWKESINPNFRELSSKIFVRVCQNTQQRIY